MGLIDTNRYPKTDREIRIYCIESVQDSFSGLSDKDIEQARKLYDFICGKDPDETEETQGQRSLFLVRISSMFRRKKKKKRK